MHYEYGKTYFRINGKMNALRVWKTNIKNKRKDERSKSMEKLVQQ